jgi:hypothetical protein
MSQLTASPAFVARGICAADGAGRNFLAPAAEDYRKYSCRQVGSQARAMIFLD